MTRNLGIFCSANVTEEKYVKMTEEFASLMSANGYNLVWGGSDVGLMHVLASAVKLGGGKLIGVTIEVFQNVARKDADEMILAPTLSERKAIMLLRSDAIVVLVGGIGSLDEVLEILELKKEGKHNKPIIVINTDNFYDGLRRQLQKMKNEGFIVKPLDEMIHFVETPSEAIAFINSYL